MGLVKDLREAQENDGADRIVSLEDSLITIKEVLIAFDLDIVGKASINVSCLMHMSQAIQTHIDLGLEE